MSHRATSAMIVCIAIIIVAARENFAANGVDDAPEGLRKRSGGHARRRAREVTTKPH
jgi:hypothetical protein